MAYRGLPAQVKQLARQAYRLFAQNPNHPSLRFKPVRGWPEAHSVRIGGGYRALGLMPISGVIVWFWIGSHADYTNLIP